MGCCEYLGIYLGVAVVLFAFNTLRQYQYWKSIDISELIENAVSAIAWGFLVVMLIFAGIYEMIKRN